MYTPSQKLLFCFLPPPNILYVTPTQNHYFVLYPTKNHYFALWPPRKSLFCFVTPPIIILICADPQSLFCSPPTKNIFILFCNRLTKKIIILFCKKKKKKKSLKKTNPYLFNDPRIYQQHLATYFTWLIFAWYLIATLYFIYSFLGVAIDSPK